MCETRASLTLPAGTRPGQLTMSGTAVPASKALYFPPRLVAVVEHGAVVAGDDEQGVVGDAQAVEGVSDEPHGVVELQDGLAAKSHGAFAAEAFVRVARHVDVVRAEVHEERLVGIFTHESDCICRDGVGDVLVAPERPSAAFHVTDAADAVDDALVVSVVGAGFELGEQLRVAGSGGLAGKVAGVTYGDRCGGVVILDTAVLNENAGHAVGCGGHDVGIVKTDVFGGQVERTVPVLLPADGAKAEVPLADGGGGVALVSEHVGEGVLVGVDEQVGVAVGYVGLGTAETVFARQEGVARRGGRRGDGVGVGEADTAAGDAVDARRRDAFGAITGEVAVAEVVGHEQDDVRAFGCGLSVSTGSRHAAQTGEE